MSKVYQIITDKIIVAIEAGVCPWRKSWTGIDGMPKRFTGQDYRGVNTFLLSLADFNQPIWMTYKQAKKVGAEVKKGSKAMPVTFFNFLKRENKETGKETKIPMLRYYNVFNVEQLENVPEKYVSAVETFDHNPIQNCEEILSDCPEIAGVTHGGDKAYYRPSTDSIQMPNVENFTTREAYYCTLFHEMIHATSKHLSRDLGNSFGSDDYAKEELIAELGAAMLCGVAGIDNSTIDNSASYLANWLKRFKNDSKLIVSAAGQAQRAVDYILGNSWEDAK